MDLNKKVEELTSRIITLEAIINSGNINNNNNDDEKNKNENKYEFLKVLEGNNLIEAKTLIEENKNLNNKVISLQNQIDEFNYRINHLKQGLDHFYK